MSKLIIGAIVTNILDASRKGHVIGEYKTLMGSSWNVDWSDGKSGYYQEWQLNVVTVNTTAAAAAPKSAAPKSKPAPKPEPEAEEETPADDDTPADTEEETNNDEAPADEPEGKPLDPKLRAAFKADFKSFIKIKGEKAAGTFLKARDVATFSEIADDDVVAAHKALRALIAKK